MLEKHWKGSCPKDTSFVSSCYRHNHVTWFTPRISGISQNISVAFSCDWNRTDKHVNWRHQPPKINCWREQKRQHDVKTCFSELRYIEADFRFNRRDVEARRLRGCEMKMHSQNSINVLWAGTEHVLSDAKRHFKFIWGLFFFYSYCLGLIPI